jgi:hypothetical protein
MAAFKKTTYRLYDASQTRIATAVTLKDGTLYQVYPTRQGFANRMTWLAAVPGWTVFLTDDVLEGASHPPMAKAAPAAPALDAAVTALQAALASLVPFAGGGAAAASAGGGMVTPPRIKRTNAMVPPAAPRKALRPGYIYCEGCGDVMEYDGMSEYCSYECHQ